MEREFLIPLLYIAFHAFLVECNPRRRVVSRGPRTPVLEVEQMPVPTREAPNTQRPYPIQRIDGDLYLIAPSGRRVELRPAPEIR